MKTELVTNLKRQATQIIASLERSSSPILITEHGRGAAYLLSVHAFHKLQKRMKILEGIARGEKAIREGRVLSQAQAKRKMKRWLK
ncbi:MAG: type II toxin-antitoxin system Phd/YefM family antitoxin [Deltaproteobacteria bacterium]|nr:type II toxin-antitoxin system Phd/YefM family antitoxin [Deltaproteobacteria bacterium]